MARSFSIVEREARRVIELANRKHDNPALTLVGGQVLPLAQGVLSGNDQVRAAETAARKELADTKGPLARLAGQVDETIQLIVAFAPHEKLPMPTSACNTSDDLLASAEDVEAILTEHAAEEWTKECGPVLSALIEEAAKEWSEHVAADATVQKVADARAVAVSRYERGVVPFRRLVRKVYGASSKEYQSIRVRRPSEPQEPVEPTA